MRPEDKTESPAPPPASATRADYFTDHGMNKRGTVQKPSKRILYLGSFLDESIVAERGLRSHNAAGSNRMMRIAQALRSTGLRPILLSPATSLRAVRKGGPWLHPAQVRRRGGVAVVYAPALNVIGLNMLTAPLFQLAVMWSILRQPLAGSLVYNFSPGLVLLTAWLALKRGLLIINNVEDVSVPRLSDWLRKTEARPAQQFVFWLCMCLVARMSDAYLVPTRRFLPYLPRKRSVEVVTGCIDIPPLADDLPAPPMCVLYAGKVEREHGIVQFVEALEILDATPAAARLRVDVSGAGSMSNWVTERLGRLTHISARQHGFVTFGQYTALLEQAHICVVLQNPEGRYAEFKTPSKIYEFLAHGKGVIATRVGDITELPANALVLLDGLSAEEIAARLNRLVVSPDKVADLQRHAGQHAAEAFSYDTVGRRLGRLLRGEAI